MGTFEPRGDRRRESCFFGWRKLQRKEGVHEESYEDTKTSLELKEGWKQKGARKEE